MVVAGVEVVRGDGDGVVDLGICTTPQLHFVVRGRWRGEKCSMAEYYAGLVREYRSLRGDGEQLGEVVVDCANGVGAIALQGVEGVFDGLHVVNRAGDGPLNSECGADYVQKKRIMPTVFGGEEKSWAKDTVWASLDGDADRLVMYRRAAGSADGILLADGDYFATLSAMFINKHLARAGLGDVLIGVAQTAYSNGAATEYLEGLRGVKVVIAKTGVKHLEVAVEKFDIGIYWEPNGHGTIMYSDCMVKRLTETLEECEGEMLESVKVLLSVGRLANQAVGDGVADMLLALAMLSRQGMYFDDWLCTYAERCSANLVVRVADKNVIVTADCDREVVEPTALRASITEVCQGDGRRAFVRPSGTEDVVRVYAEAPPGREEDAWIIAKTIARAVFDTCGGVGERV
jgi:phosphoacetylglucosamine mutase